MHDEGGSKEGRMRAQNWCDLPKGVRRYLQIDAGPIRDAEGRDPVRGRNLAGSDGAERGRGRGRGPSRSPGARFRDHPIRARRRASTGSPGRSGSAIETRLPEAADALREDFNLSARGLRELIAVSPSRTRDDGRRRDRRFDPRTQRPEPAPARTLGETAPRSTASPPPCARTPRAPIGARRRRAAKVDAEKSGVVVARRSRRSTRSSNRPNRSARSSA